MQKHIHVTERDCRKAVAQSTPEKERILIRQKTNECSVCEMIWKDFIEQFRESQAAAD